METIPSFPDLVLPEISFPVLDYIINYPESFIGLLEYPSETFKIIVSPNLMATVLRDDHLYGILKNNPDRFLHRLYLSLGNAVSSFTAYDWKRLFALSPVPLNFNTKNTRSDLKMINYPVSCISLKEAIDLVKDNMINFILLGTSINRLKLSLDDALLYYPLLKFSQENDEESFRRNMNQNQIKL